ncbi:hypothetical protein QBC39DRAFT_405466 [Podospora conica]|nr:hypothetical protein QBC39DRAFT_405466 [Schizothecium conicum]
MSAPTRILRAPQASLAARQPTSTWPIIPRPSQPALDLPISPPSLLVVPRTIYPSARPLFNGFSQNLPPPKRPQPATTQSTTTAANSSSAPTPSDIPNPSPQNTNSPPPDDRKVKLGKTLRILQDRLPTLLQKPLPQAILAPKISLRLFPSTHPHLPAVSGRVAYMAALWSAPLAWNRVPLVGNVRLEILSERMVQPHPSPASSVGRPTRPRGAVGEQLVVRWRTRGGNDKNWLVAALVARISGGGGKERAGDEGHKAPVGNAQAVGDTRNEFTGLFIFDFDGEGRILSHTIEHVEESGQWERGVGAKVVGLTDWLLGGMKGPDESPCPAFTGKPPRS